MMNWQGVLPAITTPLLANGEVDHVFLARHARWMIENGCRGVVALGSLGVVAGISALSTADAVALAQVAQRAGCQGLMVLPPYVYSTDWREMKAHVAAICGATDLSCMIYNNPVAYKTDFLAAQIEELADEFPNVHAVKESSADARRVTALKARLGDRLAICVGVDDVVVEGIAAGATGWVAGLVNAFPRESVQLFDLALAGDAEAFEIYRWFLPLLALDTVPKFVQLIKLAQQEAGCGSETVRAPRLVLTGQERELALHTIRDGLANMPASASKSAPFVLNTNGAPKERDHTLASQ